MRRTVIGFTVLTTFALAGCSTAGAAAGSATSGGGMPLEGTAWSLVEVGGQPARPSGDATPSLRLDAAEKRASGNSGCNSFSGEYVLNGESLRFGPLASTRRACVDQALNRQEAALLGALEATRSWRTAGDSLVLSGGAGVVARFVAAAR